jgi:phosphopantothenoylcysteine synthetase/decarboxylase
MDVLVEEVHAYQRKIRWGIRRLLDQPNDVTDGIELNLRRSDADILRGARAGKREGRRRPLLVGFAAETADLLVRAKAKRLRKGIDVIVANDVSREDAGFDVDSNAVTIIDDAGEETLPLQSKTDVARALGDRLERWLLAAPAPAGTHA